MSLDNVATALCLMLAMGMAYRWGKQDGYRAGIDAGRAIEAQRKAADWFPWARLTPPKKEE